MHLSNSSHRRTHRGRRILAAMVVPVLAALPAGSAQAQDEHEKTIEESEQTISASSQRVKEREAERRELRELAETATASLDVAQATADDLIAALDAARASVNAQQEALDNAARAVAEAEAVESNAAARIAELQEQMEAAEQGLKAAVIESFVTFQTPDGSLSVLSEDLWENDRLEALASFTTGSQIDSIDDLRRLGAELERWRLVAEEATASAVERREQAAKLLAELEAAQMREAAFVLEAEERLETRLYEVQTLRALDSSLAGEIEREERRIAEALSRKRSAQEAQRRAEEEARRRAEAAASGGETIKPDHGDFTLVWVRGIQVNTEIAGNLARLLDAMDAEGIPLKGWGYRTHADQIALRKAHCGTSDYAIWEMPSHRCRPPTARPGRSNHEKGLAVDFTHNGRTITSRSSAAFQALKRLAPQFGLKNLPSEPWHWSVDGR